MLMMEEIRKRNKGTTCWHEYSTIHAVLQVRCIILHQSSQQCDDNSYRQQEMMFYFWSRCVGGPNQFQIEQP